MIMETVVNSIGYLFIALVLAAVAYTAVRIFTNIHDDDDD